MAANFHKMARQFLAYVIIPVLKLSWRNTVQSVPVNLKYLFNHLSQYDCDLSLNLIHAHNDRNWCRNNYDSEITKLHN